MRKGSPERTERRDLNKTELIDSTTDENPSKEPNDGSRANPRVGISIDAVDRPDVDDGPDEAGDGETIRRTLR